ncbi:hypothetical protein EPI10_021760 [Gossypium australe]|uniref:Uncharacterized protein n=1 Tax=Gossypium australe TaxID=47621 RepID=A0A5B6WI87_9ROSI|nr:hypothetical protein EPI10_021760 [Gossypium australe]
MQPPFPKQYDANAQWEYHAGTMGHSIENCTASKKLIKRFFKMGIVRFDDPSRANVTGNPLPRHPNQGVNTIIESGSKRTKIDVTETSRARREEKFVPQRKDQWRKFTRSITQMIIYRPRSNEAGTQATLKVIIQKLVIFPYKDRKRVPRNYDCNVMIPGEENSVGTSEEGQDIGFFSRSGRCYDPVSARIEPIKGKTLAIEHKKEKIARFESLVNEPVTENEAKEFLKFLKYNEYSVVEHLHKQPARISVLALVLSSETHRSALMKVLNETSIIDNISVNKLNCLVNNLSAGNFIFFNDDEIPPWGMGSTKALHITTYCKGYTLQGVLIDNGSALNVLPLSTLNRLSVDSSHMKTCQNIVRAFDGTGG